jgi:hypothetical protein
MKRAQFSVEYLFVMAFGMTTLLIIAGVYFAQTRNVSEDRQQTLVEIMGRDVVTTAKTVYHAGSLSKKTLRYTMPQIVNNVYVSDDQAFVFNVTSDGATYDLVYYADVPIEGYFPETKIYTEQIAHILVLNCGDEVLLCSEEYGCSASGETGCPSS